MEFHHLDDHDPELFTLIQKEENRQREQLQLIPSENYASKAVLEPLSSLLSNKYSEGYPGKRYYEGNEYIDMIEELAVARAQKLFGAEYVNVQPLSGTPANLAAYMAFLKPGDTILSMNLASGGHLSHGSPVNITSQLYNIVFYDVDPETEILDYAQIRKVAQEAKPQLIIAGASAYPRTIDFAKFAEIAHEVSAYLMADIAHIAGLVATGLHPSPIPYADVITTTTHKTLRGPRSGMIMARAEYAKQISKAVFPGGVQAGPHNNVHAAKAVCFLEALQPEFTQYIQQVVKNSRALSEELNSRGFRLVSGGSDNHLLLIDLRNKHINGKEASVALDKAAIITNANMIPYDPATPFKPSGIRLGTPAITSRGMKEQDMKIIADFIDRAIQNRTDENILKDIQEEVNQFASPFPVPGLDD